MSALRQAAQQALEALEDMLGWQSLAPQTIQESAKGRAAALRAALADGDNLSPTEPVAWIQPRTLDGYLRSDLGYETCSKSDYGAVPVYTAPPQRKPLTEDEIGECLPMGIAPHSTVVGRREIMRFARAIERAHGIKEAGCDHCNHPLYAAIKCNNCGRVTE